VPEALLAARRTLGAAPLVVHEGDAVVTEHLGPLVDEFRRLAPELLLVTQPAAVPAEVPIGARPLTPSGHPTGATWFDQRPPAAIFSSASIDALLELELGELDSSSIGSAAAVLAETGHHVLARSLAGSWCYADNAQEVLEANRRVLDQLGSDAVDRDDCRIEGRVAVHPTARLERTTVRGPAVIGANAELTDTFIGPYTSVGEQTRIEGSEIEYSILLAGACLRHVGRRIEGSIVGENASVCRDFGLPASLRLQVGQGASISLA
jgi:glucose-1-phosphate thymidylyltransferase